MAGIGTVTLEALVREDGSNVSIELDLRSRFFISAKWCGAISQQKANRNKKRNHTAHRRSPSHQGHHSRYYAGTTGRKRLIFPTQARRACSIMRLGCDEAHRLTISPKSSVIDDCSPPLAA